MSGALIVALAFIATAHSAGSAKPLGHAYPPHPFVSTSTCPGELCRYGEWTACGVLRVFATERDTSKVTFTIPKGERFVALDGNVHVLRPGVVRARHRFAIETDSLRM